MSDHPSLSGRIDPAALEDIKRRTDLVGLVQALVPLRRTGSTWTGPCPICGGGKSATRFEVKPAQQVWVCAVCQDGGDVIAFVMKHDGLGFREAIASLGGPRELNEEARKKLEQRAKARTREAERRDEKARTRALEIWAAGETFDTDGIGPAYFESRGLAVGAGEKVHSLRVARDLDYWWNPPASAPFVIHKGPALLAAIVNADGAVIGVHCTYLRADYGGKLILPARDGEVPPAKKIRGRAQGGAIRLTLPAPLLLIGEGIETTRAAWLALRARGHECAAWAGVSLGNIAGASLGRGYRHPSKANLWVPDWQPDPERPGLMPPAWAREIILLGDGDSDALMTRARLDCAAARYTAAGFAVRLAWADEGKDFNDMVRG